MSTSTPSTTLERVQFGAAAYMNLKGKLPNVFPRVMGPNAGKYVQEVVESGLTSDIVSRLEKALADKLGVRNCVAAPGCTNAMLILGETLQFAPGDEVVVSSITDYGNLIGVVKRNWIPVFADTEPGSLNISARTIEAVLTDRTRAILLTHKTGLVCDMDPIMELAAKRNLLVIEDVCQAFGSRYKGRMAGTIGDVGAFSFDSEKTLGSDIGGALVTNDDGLATRMRFMGQSRGGVNLPGFGRAHTEAGQALRMPLCTAAVTLAQLEVVDENIAQRDRMIRLIATLLEDIPGIVPVLVPDYQDVYSCWMAGFSMAEGRFDCSAEVFAAECAKMGLTGAGTAGYYNMPEALVFLQEAAKHQTYPFSLPPASRKYRYGADTCPNAKTFLDSFVRWCTFSERYTEAHCHMLAHMVRTVADQHRRTPAQKA